ncbi:hypothetical protein ES705_14331 [subsurface metagenome]
MVCTGKGNTPASIKYQLPLSLIIMRRKVIEYIILIFICSCSFQAKAQSLIALKDYVIKKDKFAVDKAIDKIKEAGELTQEANNYYNEALELQSNYKLDEQTLQKKLAKVEKKALETQMKADKIYTSAYKSLYEICQKTLQATGTVTYGDADSFIETAEEMMNNASSKRKEASGVTNPYEKAAMLNDAAGMENTAIENMIVAFKAQAGEDVTSAMAESTAEEYYDYQEESYASSQEESYTSEVYQVSENLAIDKNIIQKYEDYVSDESIPDPIMINRSGVVGVSEASVDQARIILHEYTTGDISAMYTDKEPSLAILDSISSITQTEEVTGTIDDEYASQYEERIIEMEEPTEAREVFDISYVTQSKGVRFMVQLAASRIPLNRAQMWAIYPGNLTIGVIREDNWYKYRITGFRLFSEANRVAIKSGVKYAWVLSSNDGILINLVEARDMTRVLEADVKRRGRGVIENETDFFVQVLASKIRLNEQEMNSHCGYSGRCREIIEEGWFKYQIYAGTSYQEALSLKNEITGKSFIVTYKAGSKQNLYKAIHNK